MANILGLHFGHDGAVAIVKGNKLVTAIASERLTRKKKSYGSTKEGVEYCLKQASLTINDINCVVMTDYFREHNNGLCKLIFSNGQEPQVLTQVVVGNDILSDLECEILGVRIPAFLVPHHLAHCAAAFYTSPFESAICFSLDSSTGYTAWNSLVAVGYGNTLKAAYCPKLMIGNAYTKFTYNLGVGDPLHKAGATMGLASYGNVLPRVVKNIKSYVERSFFDKELVFEEEFKKFWFEISGGDEEFKPQMKDSKKSMDIAASIQYIFEESILHAIRNIQDGNNTNLCLSGGSMLNCNINSRILKETKYKNIHLFPACGDDGLAVGAALYMAYRLFKESRYKYKNQEICYLGQPYDIQEGIDYEYLAKQIDKGKIIAWFQGKSEYGPRALGNRSILADPRNFHNRELLNFVIKKREWFRPFAPVVLEEECSRWFDFNVPSPFMLFTAQVKNPKEVPAITHIDNSARMQTINSETNPQYYNIVKAFYNLTGIPMLINTSLNGAGEPILENVEDANKFFDNSTVDVLVLNGKIIER